MPYLLRPGVPADHDAVVAINQAEVPAVGPMDVAHLARLAGWTELFLVAEDAGAVVGFCLLMAEGQPYESLNYRWFAERHPRFLYVDRIAIAPAAQGRGLGRTIYDACVAHGSGRWPVLTAEVNLVPRNDQSLAFHERYGFAEVGQQDVGDGKRVRLVALPLPAVEADGAADRPGPR